MNQKCAEAPTVIGAINEVLYRSSPTSSSLREAKFGQNVFELPIADHLLVPKGKLGPFDFLDSISSGRTLFVGEGNLSFCLALARLKPGAARAFVVTTFESPRRLSSGAIQNAGRLVKAGAKVFNGVDATRLDTHFGTAKFHSIIFNFPNVASRVPVYGHNPNHNLARKFLRGAAKQLARGGHVVISVVDTPFYAGAFGLPAAAKFAGFAEPEIHEFKPTHFPGYVHTNTFGGESALAKYRTFSTWVFRLP